jgi:hypothetical protein
MKKLDKKEMKGFQGAGNWCYSVVLCIAYFFTKVNRDNLSNMGTDACNAAIMYN